MRIVLPNGFSPRDYQREAMAARDAGCRRNVWVWQGAAASGIVEAMLNIPEGFIARFMGRVRKADSGCWLWEGYVDKATGYGRNSSVGDPYRVDGAHRVSWIIHTRAPIPSDRHVLHTCDVKTCVNPEHLYLGSRTDNARDAVARGQYVKHNALKTHCANGHDFTPENTLTYTSARGRGGKMRVHRECRACNRKKALAYYHKRRAEARV